MNEALLIYSYMPDFFILENDLFLEWYAQSSLPEIALENEEIITSASFLAVTLIELSVTLYVCVVILILFLNIFTNGIKEEKQIDTEFLSTALLIESEKEITTSEDLYIFLSFFIFLFS